MNSCDVSTYTLAHYCSNAVAADSILECCDTNSSCHGCRKIQTTVLIYHFHCIYDSSALVVLNYFSRNYSPQQMHSTVKPRVTFVLPVDRYIFSISPSVILFIICYSPVKTDQQQICKRDQVNQPGSLI